MRFFFLLMLCAVPVLSGCAPRRDLHELTGMVRDVDSMRSVVTGQR